MGVAEGPVSNSGDGLEDVLCLVVMAGGEHGRFDGLVACEVPIMLSGGVADDDVLSISTLSNASLNHMSRSHDHSSYLQWLWRGTESNQETTGTPRTV